MHPSLLLFVVVGLLVAGLALPLQRRRVKPNALYGLRVHATYADESVWYDANAATGRDMVGVGLLTSALSIVLVFVPGVDEELHAFIMAGVLVVGLLVMAGVGIARANRMLRERQGGGRESRGARE